MPAVQRLSRNSYTTLKEKIAQTLQEGRRRAERLVENEKLRTHWNAGRLIENYVRKEQKTESGRAQYGKKTVQKLSRDLEINPTDLYYSWVLAKTNPIFSTLRKLRWSHHRLLLTVKDPEQRKALEEQAFKEDWTIKVLEQKISGGKAQSRKEREEANRRFVPKRGKLQTYRIAAGARPEDPLRVDLGFSGFRPLNPDQAQRFKEGDLVEGTAAGALKKSSATKFELYTYKARVLRVVDGDTLWVNVYSGLETEFEQKLRLRAIDAPERDTPEGQTAKKFVEDALAGLDFIEITTTKPDKWDRYLSDIWIGEINLNKQLLDYGYAFFKDSYSPEDWLKE